MPRKKLHKKNQRVAPPIMNPDAAGIDIGATEIYVAVPADRDPEPIRMFATFTEDLNRDSFRVWPSLNDEAAESRSCESSNEPPRFEQRSGSVKVVLGSGCNADHTSGRVSYAHFGVLIPDHLHDGDTNLCLFQHPDDLLHTESLFLHQQNPPPSSG
jgi:hypothetical protein